MNRIHAENAAAQQEAAPAALTFSKEKINTGQPAAAVFGGPANETELQLQSALEKIQELSARLGTLEQAKNPHVAVEDNSQDLEIIPAASELQAELDDLLELQAKHMGSDIHIKAGAPPMIRLEGDLIPVGEQSLTDKDTRRLILPMMTREMRRRLSQGKEIDFSYHIKCGRFRVNAYMQRGMVSASLRLVKSSIPDFKELGLPGSIKKVMGFTKGIFLVTGPTGSGKSTTLASLLEHMNKTSKYHIITIEDPLEYLFEDKESIVSQREVGIDTESYAEGIRSALRQDPNIIMLGELRDTDTVTQALMAAETGHLVLSTLHTNNAIQAINRILDFFPPNDRHKICATLSTTLCGVLSQKLVQTADMERRVLATELMYTTATISGLIREGSTHEIYPYIREGTTEGMFTFTHSLLHHVRAGNISVETARAAAEEQTEFGLALRQLDTHPAKPGK